MTGIKKKLYIYIGVFGFVALCFSRLIYTWANPSQYSYYYVIKDADDQYYVINGNSGATGEGYRVATSSNAAYDWVEIPEGQAFCSWQVIKVEPDVFDLPVSTEPGATPSDATPSDSTPSEATPPDASPSDATITEYEKFLKPGQHYGISEIKGYANDEFQIAFQPRVHDRHTRLVQSEVVEERTRTITYKLVFEQGVSYTGTLAGNVVVDSSSDNGTAIFTVTKPTGAGTGHLVIDAHYNCPNCGEEIALEEEYVIQVPRYTVDNSEGSDEDEEPVVPGQPDPGNSGGSGGNSGGTGEASDRAASESKEGSLTIDYSAPERNGWYYTLPKVTIQAGEDYQVYYQLWNTSQGRRKEQTPVVLYTGQMLFDEDGVYQCSIWAEKEGSDAKYHESSMEFKLDRNEPQISLRHGTGFEHGNYYSASQEVIVSIDEVNFSEKNVQIIQSNAAIAGVWKHEGNRHTAAVLFETDGLYNLDVKCTDLAGHYSQLPEKQTFVIDTKAPMLKIEGVQDLTANKDAVIPVITYSDENLDTGRTEIILESYEHGEMRGNRRQSLENGSYICTFSPIEEDDNYTLRASIYDKAGNLTEKIIRFSINQNGATFVFRQKEIVGMYTNQTFYPAIEIWNVDEMTVVSLTLNGQDVDYDYEGGLVTFKDPVDKDGKYVIGLEVKDTSGNLSVMKPIEFFFDQTKPVNIIQGVTDGGVYHAPVTIQIHTEQKNDFIKEVSLNGQVIDDYEIDDNGVISLQILTPGEYRLSVVSEDLAGNISDTDTVSFVYELSEESKLSSQMIDQDFGMWWIGLVVILSVAVLGYWRRRTR